ncbi:MAG: hypothetical protein ABR534_14335 [Desulfotignum sp.]|nr:hypothetical protein [Desulfobacteraceae bacterium]
MTKKRILQITDHFKETIDNHVKVSILTILTRLADCPFWDSGACACRFRKTVKSTGPWPLSRSAMLEVIVSDLEDDKVLERLAMGKKLMNMQ